MIAWALSGGGNLGAAQVGALEIFMQRLGPPEMLSGVSVGAVNAAAVALDPSPEGIRYLKERWLEVTERDVFPGRPLGWAWRILTRKPSISDQRALEGLLRRWIPQGVVGFGDLKLPLYVVGTDLRSGTRISFGGKEETTPLLEALLVSTCLPGVFAPRGSLVDGGVVAHVALRELVEAGAKTIYAIVLGFTDMARFQTKTWASEADVFGIVLRSLYVLRGQQIRLEIIRAKLLGAEVRVLYLAPEKPISFWDFTKTRELMQWGAERAERFLQTPHESTGT